MKTGAVEAASAYTSGVISTTDEGGNYYVRSDLNSFCRLHIMGDYTEILNMPTWWDYFVEQWQNWFPTRDYYRLVNAETGEVASYLTENKTANDFEYVGDADSYCASKEGYFWKKAIPKDLIKAINNAMNGGDATLADPNYIVNAEDVKNILEIMYENEIGKEDGGFTKYVPVLLEVKHHWYRNVSFKGCYKWDDSESAKTNTYAFPVDWADEEVITKLSEKEVLFLEENGPGSIEQIKDGKRVGEAGGEVKKLLYNKDGSDILYYKFDGSGRSEEKSKIDFGETAVDAIGMLEEIEGEDSQAIIRDYKALMKSFGIFFEKKASTNFKKKLFSKVIEGYSNENNILPEGDDSVIRASIPPAQVGFSSGLAVKSPANGNIVYRTDDSVCIEIIAPKEDIHEYTILIEGFDVSADTLVGNTVTEGTKLGETRRQDLKLTLRDDNGAIVKNSYTAGPQEYKAQPGDEYILAALMHQEICSDNAYFKANTKVRDEEGDWVNAFNRENIGGGLTDISRTCAYVCINNTLLDPNSNTIVEYIKSHPSAYDGAENILSANEHSGNYCEKCLENAKWCLKYDCSSVVSSEGIPMTRNCTTESGFDKTNSRMGGADAYARWWLIDINGDGKITDFDINKTYPCDCFFLRNIYSEYEADAEPVVEYDEEDLELTS